MDRFLLGFGQVFRAAWIGIAAFMIVSGLGRLEFPPDNTGPAYLASQLEGKVLIFLFLLLGWMGSTLWLRAVRQDIEKGDIDVDEVWLGKGNRRLVLSIGVVFAGLCVLGYYVFREASVPNL